MCRVATLRLLTLPVLVLATLVFGGQAQATTITGYSPANGATVTGPRPTLTINASNQNSADQSFFIRLTNDTSLSSGGQLFGGSLLVIPAGGGGVQPNSNLAPGVYYWQWQYNDYGCFTMTATSPPFGFYQPDCHPDSQTTCPLFANGRCTGPIFSFTVSAPAPPPPPPPPPPTTTTTAPPTPSPPSGDVDSSPPSVQAFAMNGQAGQTLKLTFRVSDNSGSAAVTAGVFRGKQLLTRHRYPLQPLNGRYFMNWRPATAGSYMFCVLAEDAAANQSKLSCAAVTVRRR